MVCAAHCLLVFGLAWSAQPRLSAAVSEDEILALVEENRLLRARLDQQEAELAELRGMVQAIVEERKPVALADSEIFREPPAPVPAEPDRGGNIVFSGQVGVALFAGGSESAFPNAEMRIDDAIFNIEAEVTRRTYFFSELYLTRRESPDENLRLGEIYIDFENVSGLWGMDDLVSVRIGRTDIPFGEEYQLRDPFSSPLISHSVADIWGIDEGIEFYGRGGPFHYVFAVQNGSHVELHDYTSDKAVTARIGANVTNNLYVSASAMRTGELNVAREPLSEVWFGNSFFRSIGSSATTSYQARIAQLDARFAWQGGHLAGSAGIANYSDNDPAANNARDFDFFSLELVQQLNRNFYGAVRYSRLESDDGYPIAGLGNFGKYAFGPFRTTDLWRLGIGLGYRPFANTLLKMEYTFEEGTLSNGASRTDTNLFSTEAVVQF